MLIEDKVTPNNNLKKKLGDQQPLILHINNKVAVLMLIAVVLQCLHKNKFHLK